jgi:RNA polymerase sigma-70 factor (ECF subfamily)
MDIGSQLGEQVRVVPALGGETVHVLLALETGQTVQACTSRCSVGADVTRTPSPHCASRPSVPESDTAHFALQAPSGSQHAARWERSLHHRSEPVPAEDLLARVADGDKGAFTGIYDAFCETVMGLACRILRDPTQAEEVTQDVMLEVWRTADRYDPERGTAKAWVLTLAHRRAVDRVRAAQAGTDREQRALALVPERDFDEVADVVLTHDEQRRVFRCLASLTRLQRVPLVLAYYEGLTYLEVAQALTTPAGTVKSRMRAGLQQLRACLEGDA